MLLSKNEGSGEGTFSSLSRRRNPPSFPVGTRAPDLGPLVQSSLGRTADSCRSSCPKSVGGQGKGPKGSGSNRGQPQTIFLRLRFRWEDHKDEPRLRFSLYPRPPPPAETPELRLLGRQRPGKHSKRAPVGLGEPPF